MRIDSWDVTTFRNWGDEEYPAKGTKKFAVSDVGSFHEAK